MLWRRSFWGMTQNEAKLSSEPEPWNAELSKPVPDPDAEPEPDADPAADPDDPDADDPDADGGAGSSHS